MLAGLVVAPGLIELHTHGEDKLNYEFRAMDGVTTMLDTERGTVDVDQWYADRDGKTLVNYGISAGHPAARVQVVGGNTKGFHFSGPARTSAATPEQIEQIASLRPPRARTRRARRRLDAVLYAGGHPGRAQEDVRGRGGSARRRGVRASAIRGTRGERPAGRGAGARRGAETLYGKPRRRCTSLTSARAAFRRRRPC